MGSSNKKIQSLKKRLGFMLVLDIQRINEFSKVNMSVNCISLHTK